MRNLALFARRPRPGHAKTRLSPALPPALACSLHHAMILDAIAVLSLTRSDQRRLYWDEPGTGFENELPESTRIRVQIGAHLGDRLAAAFAEMLENGGQAVVFGTDCPGLGPAELLAMFGALENSDLTLLPATDGGFVAIGLRRSAPALFRDIAWSTAAVLEQTLGRANQAGLTVRVLGPALDDLDTPQDLLLHLERQAGSSRVRAPALDRALRAMGLMPPA